MNIRHEQREMVTGRLSAHLLETGLARTSLRQLAAAAGVSDRMLLYYFSDKAEVLAAAMARIAGELAMQLAVAIPDGTHFPPRELVRRAAQFTIQPEMRRFMRLWIELVAAAAKGEEPYGAIVAQIMAGFRLWVAARLDAPPDADREALAAAIIAVIDGLALVEMSAGEDLGPRMIAALDLLMAES
jgi:AcrR family transcriptional regulator